MPIAIKKPQAEISGIAKNIARLTDFEIRAVIAQILKNQANKEKDEVKNKELSDAVTALLNLESAIDEEKIKATLAIFYNHPLMKKADGTLRENLNPDGVFGKYLLSFLQVPNGEAGLASVLYERMSLLLKISSMENERQRDEILLHYPPTLAEDLKCLGGTGSRAEEIERQISSSPFDAAFIEACGKVYSLFLERFKPLFDPGNEVHFPRYLDYVLGLKTPQELQKIDENYLSLKPHIPSKILIEIFQNFSGLVKAEILKEIERKFEEASAQLNGIVGETEGEFGIDLSQPFNGVEKAELVTKLFRKLNEIKESYGLKNAVFLISGEEDEAYLVNPAFIDEFIAKKLSLSDLGAEIQAAKWGRETQATPVITNITLVFTEHFATGLVGAIKDASPEICANALEIVWGIGNKCAGNAQIHFCQIFEKLCQTVDGKRVFDAEILAKLKANLPEIIHQNIERRISEMQERFDNFYPQYLAHEERLDREHAALLAQADDISSLAPARRNRFYLYGSTSTDEMLMELRGRFFMLYDGNNYLFNNNIPPFLDHPTFEEGVIDQTILRPDVLTILAAIQRKIAEVAEDFRDTGFSPFSAENLVMLLLFRSIWHGEIELYKQIKGLFQKDLSMRNKSQLLLNAIFKGSKTTANALLEERDFDNVTLINAIHPYSYNSVALSLPFLGAAVLFQDLLLMRKLIQKGAIIDQAVIDFALSHKKNAALLFLVTEGGFILPIGRMINAMELAAENRDYKLLKFFIDQNFIQSLVDEGEDAGQIIEMVLQNFIIDDSAEATEAIKHILEKFPHYQPSSGFMYKLVEISPLENFKALLEKYDVNAAILDPRNQLGSSILHAFCEEEGDLNLLPAVLEKKPRLVKDPEIGYPTNYAAAMGNKALLNILFLHIDHPQFQEGNLSKKDIFCDSFDSFLETLENFESEEVFRGIYFLTSVFLSLDLPHFPQFTAGIFDRIFSAIDRQKSAEDDMIKDRGEPFAGIERANKLQELLVGRFYDYVNSLQSVEEKAEQINLFSPHVSKIDAQILTPISQQKLEEIKAEIEILEKQKMSFSRKRGATEEEEVDEYLEIESAKKRAKPPSSKAVAAAGAKTPEEASAADQEPCAPSDAVQSPSTASFGDGQRNKLTDAQKPPR